MPIPDFSTIPPSPVYETHEFKDIKSNIQQAKKLHKKIIFASGIFDGLHQEHTNFLHLAKQENGFLVVALESDTRTKLLKGPLRPVHNQIDRLQEIKKLPFVDEAFILPDDFSSPTRFEEVVWQLKPDILAVSSHSNHIPYKTQVMERYGGILRIVHQHNPQISTTKLLEASDDQSESHRRPSND